MGEKMTEKRYILSHNGKEDGILDKTNDKGYYGFELARLVNELSEENERLKQTIKEVYGILCIDVDVFSDKATEHDINAYVELRELDNKDAYYIAKGTKKAIELLKKVMAE